MAIQENHKNVITLLLSKNANPDIRNYEGETAIFIAIRYGHTDLFQQLIDAGANPNLYNKSAQYPLHICVEYKEGEASRNLMLMGADPNLQDNQGHTPFHIAAKNGDLETARIFTESGANPEIRNAQLQNVWDLCNEELINELNPPEADPESAKQEAPPDDAEDPLQWNKDGKCFVCRSYMADRILLPCRHRVVCQHCSSRFFEEHGKCPLCDSAVYAAIKG